MFKKLTLKVKIAILAVLISVSMSVLGLYGYSELKSMDKFVEKSIDDIMIPIVM